MPGQELDKFHRRLAGINNTRARMENIFDQGLLKKGDIETVYEGLFLRAVTSFEVFLEQLFISILMRSSSHDASRARPLLTVPFKTDMRKILMRDQDYIEWPPFHKTETRASIYLRDGKPFSQLDGGDKSRLSHITFIRNAIAHKSDHATKKFKDKVIVGLPLLSAEKSPAGYLRSQFRANPRQLRFEMYIGGLGSIASRLA